MVRVKKAKYLIIGNSAGGIGAAEAIRQADKAGTVVMISAEPYPAYSRPLISEYLAHRYPLEKILYRPADFYDKNGIQAILGRKVTQLDTGEHTASLEDGKRMAWEKLLLATGGLPILPQIKGIERSGVFAFVTLDDARAIDRHLYGGVERAVIIGGGLIGMSVAEALVKRGVKVTIVEMKERVLNTILDQEASALVEQRLEQVGVKVLTGRTVAEIGSHSGGAVTHIVTDDGATLPCELVIMAIGVQPRTQLASGAGIRINRGILVDHRMATSCPDVYACGDVAEAYDFVYGENRLTPILPNAYLGGRVAGFNMAGVTTEYPGGTAMNSLKYFGLAIVSAGMADPPADYEVVSEKHGPAYKKVVLKDGLVKGMVFAGDIEKSGIVFGLMKDKINVNGFKQALAADDFGLISLSEEIWRAYLEAPSSPSAPSAASSSVMGG
ncbi:MAG: NAD(P)/FAD-dependent oxidoreductase [Chloroflexi bacterium]|nr:NAD(P)/FAD-dependent oxidoreductase [Chloroflexota bacterium]